MVLSYIPPPPLLLHDNTNDDQVLQHTNNNRYVVTVALYLGNHFDAMDLELLKRHGITHVLSVVKDDTIHSVNLLRCGGDHHNTTPEMYYYASAGIQWFGINTEDTIDYPILHPINVWQPCLDFITKAQENAPPSVDMKLLVHCRMGVNRSAAILVALYIHLHCRNHSEAIPLNVLVEQIRQIRERDGSPYGGEDFLTNQSFREQLRKWCIERDYPVATGSLDWL